MLLDNRVHVSGGLPVVLSSFSDAYKIWCQIIGQTQQIFKSKFTHGAGGPQLTQFPLKRFTFTQYFHFSPIKAELLQVAIFFRTQFPSLGIFINKKVGNRKK